MITMAEGYAMLVERDIEFLLAVIEAPFVRRLSTAQSTRYLQS